MLGSVVLHDDATLGEVFLFLARLRKHRITHKGDCRNTPKQPLEVSAPDISLVSLDRFVWTPVVAQPLDEIGILLELLVINELVEKLVVT